MIFISNIIVTEQNWSTWWYVYTSNFGINWKWNSCCISLAVYDDILFDLIWFLMRCSAVRCFLAIRTNSWQNEFDDDCCGFGDVDCRWITDADCVNSWLNKWAKEKRSIFKLYVVRSDSNSCSNNRLNKKKHIKETWLKKISLNITIKTVSSSFNWENFHFVIAQYFRVLNCFFGWYVYR